MLFSCDQENEFEKAQEQEQATILQSVNHQSGALVDCDDVLSSVVNDDGKLRVFDEVHFVNLCDCLEEMIDDYDDTNLNYDDNQPIIDFEDNLSFNSLRAKIESSIIS